MPADSFDVRTRTLQWRIRRTGSGRSRVLLLHGAGGSGHIWEPLTRCLSPEFGCLAPDLPGHGGSAGAPRRALSLPGMAAALAELLEQLQVAPDVIIAHSAGVALAAQLITAGVLRPGGLCGIAPALVLPAMELGSPLWPGIARLMATPTVAGLATALLGTPERLQSVIRRTGSRLSAERIAPYLELTRQSSHLHGVLSMFAEWDVGPLQARLHSITCPVLLVAGVRDPWFPPDAVARVAALFPAGQIVTLPAGHLVVDELPERLAELIEPMLVPHPG